MPFGVSTDELEVIRSLSLPSGYTGVYEKRHSWQAKTPWSSRPIGVFSSPTEAAAALIKWWREQFGPNWPRVFESKGEPGWEIVAVPSIKPDSPKTVYRVTIWEEGVPRCLFPPGGEIGWPSRQDADRAMKKYIWREFGMFASYVIRRGVAPVYLRFP